MEATAFWKSSPVPAGKFSVKESLAGVVHRWSDERWTRGAFALYRPGQLTMLMPVLASAESGFHFAGEHTSIWTGWMEGALESGERAAREVLNA